MRILAVADVESKYFYDFYQPGRLKEFDLIVACGDLSREYLEFLVTMAGCPLLYVRGNHDDAFEEAPPEGCVCIEDQIFEYRGVRFLGLGGSYRYNEKGTYMYTEKEMKARIRRLWFRIRYHGGFDVLVTHAPAHRLGDMDDLPHRGFVCFAGLLDKYSPKYMLHGHVHRNYGMNVPIRTKYKDTMIINAFEHHVFNYEDEICGK